MLGIVTLILELRTVDVDIDLVSMVHQPLRLLRCQEADARQVLQLRQQACVVVEIDFVALKGLRTTLDRRRQLRPLLLHLYPMLVLQVAK